MFYIAHIIWKNKSFILGDSYYGGFYYFVILQKTGKLFITGGTSVHLCLNIAKQTVVCVTKINIFDISFLSAVVQLILCIVYHFITKMYAALAMK